MRAMFRFLLLLGLMIAPGICDVIDDKNVVTADVKQCDEAAGICDRVERLEHLVLRLQSTVTLQDNSLRQQNVQIQALNKFIRQQADVLRAQKKKLIQQQSTLKQLLNQKSGDGQDLLAFRAVYEKFGPHSAIIKHQSHTSSSFQNINLTPTMSNGSQPFKPSKLNDVEHSGSSIRSNARSVTSSDSGVHHDADSVSTQDVMSRSDDGGPLEAVVLQMSHQLMTVQADVQTLKTEVLQNAPSSTFIRWGSSSCTDHSQLVYSGVMGGGPHQNAGSDDNHLCMTMSPVISDHTVAGALGFLAGTEYETSDSHQDKDAVCAVCQSNHATTIMIPGTNVCTTGWTKQYSGIIMGGYYGHPSGSEFICVDSAMESLISGNRNDNGRLLYYIVTVCGSLPCQPYVNNKMINCVVCSR